MAPPAPVKKRIRGKRARARQRQRNGFDLRDRYRAGDLPATSSIAIVDIEDPYTGALDGAELKQARHRDGTIAEGAPGWTPPARPRIRVVHALRDDPLGRMFARRQIDQPQYLGGSGYQAIHASTQIGSVRSIDVGKTKVDGGLPTEPLTDRRQRAAGRLRHVDAAVLRHHGMEGLGLARSVLCERQSVEATARLRGATSERER